jgi:hypothetical protein
MTSTQVAGFSATQITSMDTDQLNAYVEVSY